MARCGGRPSEHLARQIMELGMNHTSGGLMTLTASEIYSEVLFLAAE